MNVAIITDSFPPMMDGVSRCALGYAQALHDGGYGNCIVVTPRMPNVNREYPFPVYGFNSVGLPYAEYRAGHPFMPKLIKTLKDMKTDILHVHSPFISMTVARQLRYILNIPIVFTQHTKWDFDIACAVSAKILCRGIERYAYNNLSAADELWAVSRGAGEYLVNSGYKGDFIVMPNGTDFTRGDPDPEQASQIRERFRLPAGVPVLLFVGRMIWYKNIALLIDALKILHERSFDFRMIFVGDGEDLPDIEKSAEAKGLEGIVGFTGRVSDRELLKAYYESADLFVFPSVYDNAPLVVREAAACGCPSLVVSGSSASEILENGETGFFADENAESVADTIMSAFSDLGRLEKISEAASEQVYLPWDKVIERSVERYESVINSYSRKSAPRIAR